MDVSIRGATLADVEAILPMVQRVCDVHAQMDPERFDFEPGVAEMYRAWLKERATDPTSVLLIAERAEARREHAEPARSLGVTNADGRLLGFIVGSVELNIPVYKTKRYGCLHDLWVEPEARHRGIGQALVVEAVRRFERIGVSQVRGETAASNDGARQLVARLGFRVGSVEVFRRLG